MSQLGLMVVAIGLSSYNLALFHLVNHSFYKAALFLGAGCIIHAVGDNQDLRKYGGLREYLPLTYSVILIASLSLIAFPFLRGFYSKDFILKSAYGQFTFSGVAVYRIAISPKKSLVLPLSRFPLLLYYAEEGRAKKNVSFFVLKGGFSKSI